MHAAHPSYDFNDELIRWRLDVVRLAETWLKAAS